MGLINRSAQRTITANQTPVPKLLPAYGPRSKSLCGVIYLPFACPAFFFYITVRPSYFLAHEQWQFALFIHSFGPLHSSAVIVVITTVLTSLQRVCIVLVFCSLSGTLQYFASGMEIGSF